MEKDNIKEANQKGARNPEHIWMEKEQEKQIKLTKEDKFFAEIEALKIVAVKVTESKTYVMFQKKAVKNLKNIWAVYSGRPEATTDEAVKDFMKSKGQIAYKMVEEKTTLPTKQLFCKVCEEETKHLKAKDRNAWICGICHTAQ